MKYKISRTLARKIAYFDAHNKPYPRFYFSLLNDYLMLNKKGEVSMWKSMRADKEYHKLVNEYQLTSFP